MRTLVTGVNGFVGGHAAAELRRGDHRVVGSDRDPAAPDADREYVPADVTDAAAMDALVQGVRPDACLHLAGLAAPADADADPARAYAVNTLGTIHLLAAVRRHAPTARVLVVSSAHVYGAPGGDGPLSEDAPLRPASLYAASKAAADEAALLCGRRFGLHCMTARPTNHIGPGQSPGFVVPAFAHQLLAIRRGEGEAVLRVGNLDSRRDFLDVRDVVRAYRLLLEAGAAASAYNIAGGRPVAVRDILDALCRLTGVHPRIEIDPARFRPTDRALRLDASRLVAHTGWRPAIPLEQTLADVIAAG